MATRRRSSRDILVERADIDGLVEGRTLCSAFAETVDRHQDDEALKWRTPDGWKAMTWRQYGNAVRQFSLGLRQLGFGPGESAVLLIRNRPEHVIADTAIVHAGGIAASLYNTSSPEQVCHVVRDCEPTTAIVETDLFEALGDIRPQLRSLRRVVSIGEGGGPGDVPWEDVLARGRENDDPAEFERRSSAVRPGDPAVLVYTSGTGGPPKGAVHTHRTVLWTLESIARLADVDSRDRLISYLPLAHSVERWWSHWRGILRGTPTYFCSDPAQLVATLVDVRPTWFLGMPRTWEKLAAAMQAAIAADPDERHRTAVGETLEVGRMVVAAEQQGLPAPPGLTARRDELAYLLTPVLAMVGLDACYVAVSGGAPISNEIVSFFHALGLRVSEGWGMTELMVGTWNGLERIKIGTVGRTLPGVEARIDPDGELLVRAGGTMTGYHADPAATARILDAQGWLRTGDIAESDDDGYFRIVDRKKDVIITAGGTKVSPAELEQLLKEHPLVGQVYVVGDGRPYVSALIVLDGKAAGEWARARGNDGVTTMALASDPAIAVALQEAVDAVNRRLARPQQIKRFSLVAEEWSLESGDMTPTLKIRRDVVGARHADQIERMYS